MVEKAHHRGSADVKYMALAKAVVSDENKGFPELDLVRLLRKGVTSGKEINKVYELNLLYPHRRRDRRLQVMEQGAFEVWGQSPMQREIEDVYASYHELEESRRKELEKAEKLRAERNAERKLEEKKRRADKHDSDEDSDEWVEVTHDMRMEEAAREAREEQEIPGPALPEHLQARNQLGQNIKANYGKDMLKGEAAAMAAYAARGERIPRRGEIGLSSAEISEFEKVGYVMSGTRHKAMEATRLRKENQVLTAEEKRLLSGFSQEERKKKESAMLEQMRSLIASKRAEKVLELYTHDCFPTNLLRERSEVVDEAVSIGIPNSEKSGAPKGGREPHL
ncbi:hypothetical protein ANCDUO_23640 [Ancylostoma duodenale]|uniref:NF-kappa-B-activating protein C-terminal domain-containing protein n=1 Tax=Ancylostoma duodenale TaxID=51022 RepID=A0A0C2FHU8_9BILA|nr:hypothetical protein ANCDUO_23640 [Ancylostoma duodenale]